MFTITGVLKTKGQEQRISDKFSKREFVIIESSNGQYPQTLLFQLVNDKCSQIEPYREGDLLKVYFNLRGREWQKSPDSEVKVFNTLDAWKIEAGVAAPAMSNQQGYAAPQQPAYAAPQQSPFPSSGQTPPSITESYVQGSAEDDLPF
jgi:single-strand DNA-binding protein